MTKPSNLSSIETATGKTWAEWTQLLDKAGAADMPHPDIAKLVHETLEGVVDNPGWWAQNVTVAYEQHIGRRVPGQNNDGMFETSVTKTLLGTKEDALALWVEAHGEAIDFRGEAVKNVRTSVTPVRLYWRCDLADGTSLTIATEQKAPDKAMIAATHTKLRSEADKEQWRQYWKELITKL